MTVAALQWERMGRATTGFCWGKSHSGTAYEKL